MVQALSAGLDRDRFIVHTGSLIGGGELIRRVEDMRLPTVHFGFRHPADPRGIARLLQYVREHRIELVQTHGLRADGIARWAARLGGARKIVSTIHSIDPWRRLPHVVLDQLTAPFVTRFVAVCGAAKAATVQRERISPDRIEVIPIGITSPVVPREKRSEIRRAFQLSEDHSPTVGVLANLREMKGHRYVIQAIPELRQKFPGIIFLFAGRDDSHGALQRYADEVGVRDHVRFMGFVHDIPSLLAAMDIFLLPSEWEGLPVSILEAMHAAVPVIATRVGGIPEVLRDDVEGLLIEPGNPAAISEAVHRVATDWAARARYVRAAESRAQTEFSLQMMIQRYTELYEQVLGSER